MYLAGVSMRRVEDITEALWGGKLSSSTISEPNKKAYVHIEDWRNRPLLGGNYPYVDVDGIYLRCNWDGEYENVAILVAIAVNENGYREVLGATEGMKEDKACWKPWAKCFRKQSTSAVLSASTATCFLLSQSPKSSWWLRCSRQSTLRRVRLLLRMPPLPGHSILAETANQFAH